MALWRRAADENLLELIAESGRNVLRTSLLLRDLLADYPDLPSSSMMDDTPAANVETQTWLKESIVPPPAALAPSE